jgi:hypothetical protein
MSTPIKNMITETNFSKGSEVWTHTQSSEPICCEATHHQPLWLGVWTYLRNASQVLIAERSRSEMTSTRREHAG